MSALAALVKDERVIEPPPGHPGKADSFILLLAARHGATVLSNDSFKEFQHANPWLVDSDRLWGYTFHPKLGWTFTTRYAVRPRPSA